MGAGFATASHSHRPGGGAGCPAFARLRELRRGRHRSFTMSNSPQSKPDRSGKSVSTPGRRQSCPPQRSRRVKRRKALVRNAAPGGQPCGQASPFNGRDYRSLTRTGAPCGASPRRFWWDKVPHALGLPRRPARRLVRPNPRAPHPAPSIGTTGWRPRTSRVDSPNTRKITTVNPAAPGHSGRAKTGGSDHRLRGREPAAGDGRRAWRQAGPDPPAVRPERRRMAAGFVALNDIPGIAVIKAA
jgi:hypothetical protein